MTTKGKIIAGSFVAVVVAFLALASSGAFVELTPLDRAFEACETHHQRVDGYSEDLAVEVCTDQWLLRGSPWFTEEWS